MKDVAKQVDDDIEVKMNDLIPPETFAIITNDIECQRAEEYFKHLDLLKKRIDDLFNPIINDAYNRGDLEAHHKAINERADRLDPILRFKDTILFMILKYKQDRIPWTYSIDRC